MAHADGPAPILNLVGDKVALGPPRRDLIPLYQEWINDFEVVRTLAVPMRPVTFDVEASWYDNLGANPYDVHFTIYERASLRPIGNSGLMQVDHHNRTAEFGIMLGAKDCWGKGYGTEVTRLVLDYGFNALDLHNIILRVYSFNPRGMRAYLRAGFREIGRRRQALRRGGQAWDLIYMDCLATEFESPGLKQLFESS